MLEPAKIFKLEFASACEANWKIPVELPYFEGHFPGRPVLPAVAIIDASLEGIQHLTAQTGLELAKVKSGKFLGLLEPGMEVKIQFTRILETDWKIEWFLNSPEGDSHHRLMADLSIQLR